MLRCILSGTLILLLAACASGPNEAISKPQADIKFVDYKGFDRDLINSLNAPLPKIQVAFYEQITPNALPERVQKWMAAVEANGGKVDITVPKSNSTISAKSPLLIISVITSLWSANKMVQEVSGEAQFNAASLYNAEVILKYDESNKMVIDKIIFHKK
ncbi:hypothetical protein [Janthinobacterium sp. B9-8]|uniref:hypothetical protein n=1 Tax=Janthinobacterium sp. B9-8 TaxID=1236179 RepID=UPI00061CE31F|nr:hypothetical protein [Janthinobacterium sp. B9-8]AMC35174.1 hypothetical protein VN23_11405 [Janthinobacterium sp. B9-8]